MLQPLATLHAPSASCCSAITSSLSCAAVGCRCHSVSFCTTHPAVGALPMCHPSLQVRSVLSGPFFTELQGRFGNMVSASLQHGCVQWPFIGAFHLACFTARLSVGPSALIRTSFYLACIGCACIRAGRMMRLSQLRPAHPPSPSPAPDA